MVGREVSLKFCLCKHWLYMIALFCSLFSRALDPDRRVCDIPLATPLTITSEVTCKAAISLLKEEGFDMVPVIGSDGNVIGVVTEGNIR